MNLPQLELIIFLKYSLIFFFFDTLIYIKIYTCVCRKKVCKEKWDTIFSISRTVTVGENYKQYDLENLVEILAGSKI